jgi:hypothetical protein
MNYNNYSISYSKGKLYLKSKEPKEGYEKVTYGTDNKVTYHKYVNSIQGVLTKAEVVEKEFEGRKLVFFEVTLIDGEDFNRVSTMLKNIKGNYTDEVKSLVSALDGAEFGSNVSLSVYKTKSDKSDKDFFNVYINYLDRLGENGKPMSTGFIPYNEVPRAEKEEDEDLGTSWNWKPVNKFYAQKIKDIEAKSLADTRSQKTAEATVSNAVNTKAQEKAPDFATSAAAVIDDLPF